MGQDVLNSQSSSLKWRWEGYSSKKNSKNKKKPLALTHVTQLVGHYPAKHWFPSQSGHMPVLWVQSLLGIRSLLGIQFLVRGSVLVVGLVLVGDLVLGWEHARGNR